MMRSDTLMQLQTTANREERVRRRNASIQGLTWSTAYQDMCDAITGIIGDMHGTSSRKSVRDILMHENRLRGLGIALVVAAVVGCLVHGMAGGGAS